MTIMPSMRSWISLALLAVAPWPTVASSLRCGNDLVSPGATTVEVLIKCGEPTYRLENRWYYDRGPTNFLKELHFVGGKLSKVENLRPFT